MMFVLFSDVQNISFGGLRKSILCISKEYFGNGRNGKEGKKYRIDHFIYFVQVCCNLNVLCDNSHLQSIYRICFCQLFMFLKLTKCLNFVLIAARQWTSETFFVICRRNISVIRLLHSAHTYKYIYKVGVSNLVSHNTSFYSDCWLKYGNRFC